MTDHHEIRPKTLDPGDLSKRPLSLERIHTGRVADDLALLPRSEKRHLDPSSPHDIGSLGYRRLIDTLNLDGKVLHGPDSIDPSTFRNNALKNLERVREERKNDIEDMAGRLGRNVVGEDFGKGSFAFKLNDGNVQFAKDLKQFAAYLGKERGFEISEGELRWQLQSGKTVESGGKRIEIELLAADEAEQQLRNEVDHLEQRKDALAAAYWPNHFKGERVYAYKKFVGTPRVEGGFEYLPTGPDATTLKYGDEHSNKIELEPAKLDEAVNYLEKICKEESKSIKQLYKDENIEIKNDANVEPEVVYAYEVNSNLYITGNPELETRDLEKLKDQGLDVPQEDIDQVDNAKRIGLPEANQKLKDQKIEKLAKEVGEEKYACRVTIEGKPDIRFYESKQAMLNSWGIPSDKQADFDKKGYEDNGLKVKIESLSSNETIKELEKIKDLYYAANEVENAIEDILKKDLRERLKVEEDSVSANVQREKKIRELAGKFQIYKHNGRICAVSDSDEVTNDSKSAREILGLKDASQSYVKRGDCDNNTLKQFKEEKQAFNQLQTLMEKDLGHKPEVIFAYEDSNDNSKKAVGLTIEEIAEKLLPANKKFSKDNLINKKKNMLEDLEKKAEHATYLEALKWYQKRVYIKNRYEEVNDKDLNGNRADPDQIYACKVYLDTNPDPKFRGIAKDQTQMEEHLQKQVHKDISLNQINGDGKFVDGTGKPLDIGGKEIRIEVLEPEGKIDLLDKLAKKRTQKIKEDHQFVFGKDIQSENVGGYIVKYSDKSEKFYPADDFSDLVQELRDLEKKSSLSLGWKNLDELAQKELKASDRPYKVDNKRFEQFGPKIEVRRIGLELTEEKMQKMHINKLYSIIEQNNEPTLKRDAGSIKISDSAERGKKIKELEADAKGSVERIKALQKDIYNEAPDAGAKWEDSCGYLVGKVFYTPKRFQQWASKEGLSKEDMSKMRVVGDPSSDPSHEHTTKSGVTYEIKRLGLERTEQEMKKSQKNIHRRLKQLLRLPETGKSYRTYRLVREVVDDKKNWTSDYSAMEISDNKTDLDNYIKNVHFEGNDVDLDGDLDDKSVGESVEYTSKDGKMRVKVECIAENEACAELDKEEKKHITEIADLQKDYGYKNPNDICGGLDVRDWDRIFFYKIRLVGDKGKDRYQILQAAKSPSTMAARLAARGIKDKDGGIAKMKQELSNIYDRNNKAENYEFTTQIVEKDGSKVEMTWIVEKAEFADIKAKMEKSIMNKRNEIIKGLASYEQENPWNYNKIYAGNYKDWGRDFCFAEVDGKLRFGKTLKDIEDAFPGGKEYKTDISPYAAVQKLERLTLDHGARITLMKSVYNEQRERVKQAFPEVNFDDPKLEIGYRFEFLSADEHYHFEHKGKCYIGASLTEAAEFLGVKRKQLVKLAELTEVDKDGYFTGSSSGIKRRQVDSKTVEVTLENRHQWAIDPMHMFKDAAGKIWFTDNENLGGLPEFKDKSMVRISKEGINIGNVVNPNPLDMPKIKVDLTDSDKSDEKKAPNNENSDDLEDGEQPIVPPPISPFLESWLSNSAITVEG